MENSQSSTERIIELLDGVYPAFAMLAGLQLDVFTALSRRPQTVQQLAEEIKVGEARLGRLLYALVQAGLLTWDGNCFAATVETGVFLNREHPRHMAGMDDLFAYLWQDVVPHAAETIRYGYPQARHDFGDMSPSEIERFLRILHPQALAAGRLLAEQHEFSGYRRLLDVGAGSGGLALALAECFPELQTTVLELPPVTEVTRQFIQAAKRPPQIIAADFLVDEIPGTYDAIVMKAFTQILGERAVRQALKKAYALLEPDGDLFIQAAILDDSRISPAWTVQFDMVLLNMYEDGRAYTESEYRGWLGATGFGPIERPDQSLIVAHKLAT